MIVVFRRRLDRREVCFTKHACEQFQARCAPQLGWKGSRRELKRRLDAGEWTVQRMVPLGIRPSWWSAGLAKDWLIVGDDDERCVFPLNRDRDGTWVAPTCMVPLPPEQRNAA